MELSEESSWWLFKQLPFTSVVVYLISNYPQNFAIMIKTFLSKFQYLLIGASIAFTACDRAPKGDEATIKEEQKAATETGARFEVDTAASRIRFTGNGVGKNHPGTFKLSSGSVTVADNQITGGEFLINIKSMDLEQKEDMFQSKLKPHLLSGDFFDADKFGTAKFEITKVEPYQVKDEDKSLVKGANFNVSGNLTLKGTTKNVTFPAHVEMNEGGLKAEADFDINRTDWQMNYGNDKTLGDKFISETVNIELGLKANKQ
jgi:polyisoprenoid-binding protein YceI